LWPPLPVAIVISWTIWRKVLYRQPEAIQAFLLQTSVLDRLTGELCDAVTGRDDGQATLEMLERANLFIVPLDGERRWYRYHQLFADLLRYRLDRVMPGQTTELHRRAYEWYAQSGWVYEAMGHALVAGDFERAARLVEETDPATMVMRGEVATLLSWLNGLPDEMVRSRPRLSLSYAWAFYVTNDMDSIDPRLQDALRALGIDDGDEDEANWPIAPSAPVDEFLSEISVLRAFVALGTVKTHTRRIYSKLDVSSRTLALARAREWNLLP